jgi:hypothetical protein
MMPLYYLDLQECAHVIADCEGLLITGLTEARAEAFRQMRELVRDGAWRRNDQGRCLVRVLDYKRRFLMAVYLWEVLASPDYELPTNNLGRCRPKGTAFRTCRPAPGAPRRS